MFSNASQAERYLSQAHDALIRKDYGFAKMMAEAAVKMNPEFFEAHNTLGTCFIIAGDPLRALACFDASLKIQPNQKEAHFNRVTALEILGQRLNLKPLDLEALPEFGKGTTGLAIFVKEEVK